MRRVTLGSVLLITLAACGTLAAPATAPTPALPSAQANAYPAPASATALPPQLPPTMTSVPTVIPSATVAAPPLTVTKIQSLPLSHQSFGVSDLIGWSPDDRYFLYDRLDRYDQASRLFLGELYAIDLSTGADMRIPKKDVILGIHSNGYTYNLGTARWSEQCCTILTSAFEQGKQAIQSVDLNTKHVTHLKSADMALFGYQGGKVGLVEKRGLVVDGRPVSQQLLDATTWLTSTVLTQHGLYTHNGRDLRYISDNNEVWDMHGDATFLKGKPEYGILQIASSPDEMMVAVVIAEVGSESWELWLVNRSTDEYILKARDFLGYPSWSADGQYLMYSINRTLMIIDLMTNGQTMVIKDVYGPVWHHTRPWFAILNQDATAIDIYAVNQ